MRKHKAFWISIFASCGLALAQSPAALVKDIAGEAARGAELSLRAPKSKGGPLGVKDAGSFPSAVIS